MPLPLPPALLQRLAKRGIVENAGQNEQQIEQKDRNRQQSQVNEEIIAEDYDDVEEPYPYDYEPAKKPQENFWSERLKRRITDGTFNGYKSCPNKYNIYHKCTLYCISAYGDGILEPKRGYTRRKQRLLRRYPLPKDWKEIYDYGCGVHYYWNTKDDNVSWLPPSHPKAVVSKSAACLRKELEALLPEIDDNDDIVSQEQQDIIEGMNLELPNQSESTSSMVIQQERENSANTGTKSVKKPKPRDLDKAIRSRRQRVDIQKRDLPNDKYDPMDPASYSDIPRGKWSAGLDNENKKTGVDSTVSGTMFQMRPYPSPGMVLQANLASGSGKNKNKNKNSDESDSNGDD